MLEWIIVGLTDEEVIACNLWCAQQIKDHELINISYDNIAYIKDTDYSSHWFSIFTPYDAMPRELMCEKFNIGSYKIARSNMWKGYRQKHISELSINSWMIESDTRQKAIIETIVNIWKDETNYE